MAAVGIGVNGMPCFERDITKLPMGITIFESNNTVGLRWIFCGVRNTGKSEMAAINPLVLELIC